MWVFSSVQASTSKTKPCRDARASWLPQSPQDSDAQGRAAQRASDTHGRAQPDTHGRPQPTPTGEPCAPCAPPDLRVPVQQHLLCKPHFDGVRFQPRPLLCREERRLGATLKRQRGLVGAAAAGGESRAPGRAGQRVFGEPLCPQPCHRPCLASAEPSPGCPASVPGVACATQCPVSPHRCHCCAQSVPRSCQAAGTPQNSWTSATAGSRGAALSPAHVESWSAMDRALPGRVGSTSPLRWASQSAANHLESSPGSQPDGVTMHGCHTACPSTAQPCQAHRCAQELATNATHVLPVKSDGPREQKQNPSVSSWPATAPSCPEDTG